MSEYFKNDDNYNRFERTARSWVGTPYRHLTVVKGRGADCGLFICGVLKGHGLLKDITYDFYASNWHVHAKTEYILNMMVENFEKNVVKGISLKKYTPEVKLYRGDILGFSTSDNKITNHVAFYMENGDLVHSIEDIGVHSIGMPNFFRHNITTIFRVMEN